MKIGVVGLGLIGGSIFKSLRTKYDVIGVSSSVQEENVSTNYESLKDCDLVFVCTPMNVTLDVLKRLEDILSSNTIVTDVCSIKGFLANKSYSYKFIPSHPMAGTENSGWKYSFPELFKKAKWVITPLNKDVAPEQKILESVIKDLGADIIVMTPEEHDKAVALISHMPLIIAQALCKNIENNDIAQQLASSGFRDTTRLALSNTEMANDMFNFNNDNIIEALKLLQESIKSLISEDYLTQIKQLQEFRRNLY